MFLLWLFTAQYTNEAQNKNGLKQSAFNKLFIFEKSKLLSSESYYSLARNKLIKEVKSAYAKTLQRIEKTRKGDLEDEKNRSVSV